MSDQATLDRIHDTGYVIGARDRMAGCYILTLPPGLADEAEAAIYMRGYEAGWAATKAEVVALPPAKVAARIPLEAMSSRLH